MALDSWAAIAGDLFLRLLVPIIAYGAYLLRDIRNELRILNGRIIKLEQWSDDHEKRDDMLHRMVVEDFRARGK